MAIHERLARHKRSRALDAAIIRAKRAGVPPEIKLELTSACNMSCHFCYNSNDFMRKRNRPEQNLTRDEIFHVLEMMKGEGIPIIRFTGGEPLLHPDFFASIDRANKLGLYVKLNTNSTTITPELAEQMRGKVDEVLFSFHHYFSQVPPQIIADKLRGMEALRDKGIFLHVNTVLTKENIPKMEWFYQKSKEYGCKHFFAFPVPTPEIPEPLCADDVKRAIDWMITMREKGEDVCAACEVAYCAYDPDKIARVNVGPHPGGHESLAVDPYGNIKISYSLPDSFGSIHDTSFHEVWNHPIVVGLRDFSLMPKPCKSCAYRLRCYGGIRSSALLFRGDMFAMDPLADTVRWSAKIERKKILPPLELPFVD